MPEPNISRLTADKMRCHRELQHKSGLTVESYCKRESISPSSWWYWRKRLLSKKVVADHAVHAPISFFQLPKHSTEIQKIEIALPNGSRLTLPLSCEPAVLRRTVRIVSSLRPR